MPEVLEKSQDEQSVTVSPMVVQVVVVDASVPTTAASIALAGKGQLLVQVAS